MRASHEVVRLGLLPDNLTGQKRFYAIVHMLWHEIGRLASQTVLATRRTSLVLHCKPEPPNSI